MTEAKLGYTLKIYFPTGDPDGLRVIEKSNWTGRGIVFPRASINAARGRDDWKRPGVYVLWGTDEGSDILRVYIGEADDVGGRLEHHHRERDFWSHSAFFVSKDASLDKAHVRYLEARLARLARDAARCKVENMTEPTGSALSESDRDEAEEFLHWLLFCLSAAGLNVFEKPPATAGPGVQELRLIAKGIEARGFESSQGFVVKAGSEMAKGEAPSIPLRLRQQRARLVEQEIVQDEGEFCRFTRDWVFSSPSAASGVLLGASSNGLEAWKDETGRSFKQLRKEQPDVASSLAESNSKN